MALLDVCGLSDWMKESVFDAKRASLDQVNNFGYFAPRPQLAVPVGVDVSGTHAARRGERALTTRE